MRPAYNKQAYRSKVDFLYEDGYVSQAYFYFEAGNGEDAYNRTVEQAESQIGDVRMSRVYNEEGFVTPKLVALTSYRITDLESVDEDWVVINAEG